MHLLILKNKVVLFDGFPETREEVSSAIRHHLQIEIRDDGESFNIFHKGKQCLTQSYGKSWKVHEILYDAWKSGYLKALPQFQIYQIKD